MSFPNIPNVTPSISLSREEVVNLLLASVAFEELGLAHIINAEAEKIQAVLGTLTGVNVTAANIAELLSVNENVNKILQTVIKKEMLLQFKLEDIFGITTTTTETTTSTTETTTTTTSTGGQGCSDGYWKTHTDNWPESFHPTDSFNTIFGRTAFDPDITLEQALGLEGGGLEALARQAVGALLNASDPRISFAYSQSTVIQMFQAAFDTGNYEDTKNLFEKANLSQCPLN